MSNFCFDLISEYRRAIENILAATVLVPAPTTSVTHLLEEKGDSGCGKVIVVVILNVLLSGGGSSYC